MTGSVVAGSTEAFAFPGERPVTPELVREHNLNELEYERHRRAAGPHADVHRAGRVHRALDGALLATSTRSRCSRRFPTTGPAGAAGAGRERGVLRLPDGWAVAFKIESHNHPSAVEPYQGAATGVGGILRDVFTMGARPIALLNCLRFGPLDQPRNRYLFAGVVSGIGDYGNCVGVPTLGGEVGFAPGYDGNPLVNAMCVGLLREDELIRAAAHGVGNVLIAVGARTGRDGIHGASFASEELSEKSEASRPQVQVGDPFTEKLLLEASLELIRAATSSPSRTWARRASPARAPRWRRAAASASRSTPAWCPTREDGDDAVRDPAVRVAGADAGGGRARAGRGGAGDLREVGADRHADRRGDRRRDLPGEAPRTHRRRDPGQRLVDDCPIYHPEARESDAAARPPYRRTVATAEGGSRSDALELLLDTPDIASKRWVYEQYDSTVQASTVTRSRRRRRRAPRPRHRRSALAVTRGLQRPARGPRSLRGRQGRRRGGGAQRRLHRRAAARHHRLPQLRQPGEAGGVLPVPRGVPRHGRRLPRVRHAGHRRQRLVLQREPDRRHRSDPDGRHGRPARAGGASGAELSSVARATTCSSWVPPAASWAARPTGRRSTGSWAALPPPVDLDAERRLQRLPGRGRGRQGLLRSAHDAADGGLAVALAEAAMGGPYAAGTAGRRARPRRLRPRRRRSKGCSSARTPAGSWSSADPAHGDGLAALARRARCARLPGGPRREDRGLELRAGSGVFSWVLEPLRRTYFEAIPRRMQHADAERSVGE